MCHIIDIVLWVIVTGQTSNSSFRSLFPSQSLLLFTKQQQPIKKQSGSYSFFMPRFPLPLSWCCHLLKGSGWHLPMRSCHRLWAPAPNPDLAILLPPPTHESPTFCLMDQTENELTVHQFPPQLRPVALLSKVFCSSHHVPSEATGTGFWPHFPLLLTHLFQPFHFPFSLRPLLEHRH